MYVETQVTSTAGALIPIESKWPNQLYPTSRGVALSRQLLYVRSAAGGAVFDCALWPFLLSDLLPLLPSLGTCPRPSGGLRIAVSFKGKNTSQAIWVATRNMLLTSTRIASSFKSGPILNSSEKQLGVAVVRGDTVFVLSAPGKLVYF